MKSISEENKMAETKELWLKSVESFLLTRVTTFPYNALPRAFSTISLPFPVANTQGLLDGLVWAFNDHPQEWVKEAWIRVLQGHVKQMHLRLEDALEVNAKSAKKESESSPEDSNKNLSSLPGHRERYYRVCAAYQDVYLSFCVLDALLKSELLTKYPELKPFLESSLPQLVCECFPIFITGSTHSPTSYYYNFYLHEAEEVYRWQFWNLLRSWITMETLHPSTHRHLEHYLKHTLDQKRLSLQMAEKEWKSQHTDPSADMDSSAKADLLASSEELLNESDSFAVLSHLSTASSTTLSHADLVDRSIRSLLHHIFPPKRVIAYRFRCQHCGAPCDGSPSTKDNHYRCHFHARNVLRPDEKIVRLLNPSIANFVAHAGDYDKTGYFPEVVKSLEAAYRGGGKGEVQIRRAANNPS